MDNKWSSSAYQTTGVANSVAYCRGERLLQFRSKLDKCCQSEDGSHSKTFTLKDLIFLVQVDKLFRFLKGPIILNLSY